MKLFKNHSILMVLVLFFCLFDVNHALAANFTQWCFGSEEIVKIGVDSDNNVWAVGRNGHIGMFNGLEWKKMASSSPASSIYDGAFMDLANGRIWVTYYTGWNCTGVSYWTQSGGWVYAGLLEADYGRTGDEIFVDKYGVVWGTESSCGELYRWDGGTGWNRVWDVPTGSTGLERAPAWNYDSGTHRIYCGWVDDKMTRYSHVSYYDINSGSGYLYPSGRLGSYIVDVIVNNGAVYMLSRGVYSWNGSSWLSQGFGGDHTELAIASNNIWACGGDYNTVETTSNSYTWPFLDHINSLAGGSHGEIYAAGDGGRFAALMGGTWYQDTNVFTDYVISAAKDAAVQARDAANAAKTSADAAKASADTASINALNTYNSVYNANGNTITAVRDASGTVLSEARQAKTNSQNASTNAQNAYNTAQTVNTKIDTLSTAVTNIQNNMGADTSPPVVKITTVSGAMATSGNSIRAIIDVSDNLSTTFNYSLDGTGYQSLPSDGAVNLPVNSSGANLITVWVTDEAGNKGRGSITIRKL